MPRFRRVTSCLLGASAGGVLLLLLFGGGCGVAQAALQDRAPPSALGAAYLLLAVATLLGLFAPLRWLRATDPRRGRWFLVCGLFLLGLAGWSLWGRVSATAGLYLLCLLVVAGGHVLGRTREDVRPLLAAMPLLVSGLVIYGVELHWLALHTHQVRWDQVFRYDLDEAPYVGPGGRLLPNLDVRMRSAEYPYAGARFVTDAEGFRNTEPVPPRAPPGELRVLSLGDSFSAGYEMDQDDFFGARLERELRALEDRPLRVLNAEVADPAHALYYLQEHGLSYRPDLVLLGLCGNDAMQAAQFTDPSGPFRLTSGQLTVDKKHAPSGDPWAPYRAVSYEHPATFSADYLRRTPPNSAKRALGELKIVTLMRGPRRSMPSLMFSYLLEDERRDGHKRLFDGTANLGMFARSPTALAEAHTRRLDDLLEATSTLVRASGAQLAVVVFPQKFQVHPEEWRAMREYWGLRAEDFDLSLPDRRLRAFCETRQILYVDLLADLREEAKAHPGTLYMPQGDIHLNVRGYREAAASAARQLEPALPR